MTHAAPTSYEELAAVLDALPVLVREARRARRLSARAAGAEIGISYSVINRLEQGDSAPGLANVTAIVRWLGKGTS